LLEFRRRGPVRCKAHISTALNFVDQKHFMPEHCSSSKLCLTNRLVYPTAVAYWVLRLFSIR